MTPPGPTAGAAGAAGAAGSRDGGRAGILWMMGAMLLFVIIDTIAKHLTGNLDYPVPMVLWARYFFHLLIVVAVLNRRLRARLATARPGLQIFRSALLLLASWCLISALSVVPLADANAVLLTVPIIVTALSVPLLREPVGARRWAGVVAGFAGAIIVARPGAGMLQAAVLLPLAAAVCFALYQIATRMLSASDHPWTTLLWTALLGTAVTSLFVPLFWRTPDGLGWLWLFLMGALGSAGHFALIKAFQRSAAVTVSSYSYTAMIWAVLLGYLVFGDLPDRWTVTGAIVIAASGLYIFRRENIRHRGASPGIARNT